MDGSSSAKATRCNQSSLALTDLQAHLKVPIRFWASQTSVQGDHWVQPNLLTHIDMYVSMLAMWRLASTHTDAKKANYCKLPSQTGQPSMTSLCDNSTITGNLASHLCVNSQSAKMNQQLYIEGRMAIMGRRRGARGAY